MGVEVELGLGLGDRDRVRVRVAAALTNGPHVAQVPTQAFGSWLTSASLWTLAAKKESD